MVNVKSLLFFVFAASAIAAPLEPIENLNATLVGTPAQLHAANDVVSIDILEYIYIRCVYRVESS